MVIIVPPSVIRAFSLRLSVSRVGEIVGRFVRPERLYEDADGVPEGLYGACGRLAQERLQFRERLLDRIEIRRIRRQIQQACAGSLDGFAHAANFLTAEIFHDHDVAATEAGNEKLADIG